MKKGLLIVFIVLMFAVCGYVQTHYSKNMVVTSVTDTDVTIEDKQGNIFAFYGDGYNVGDAVKVRFDTNGTDNTITDDIIVSVSKE
jgi:hypothetical protein